MRNLRRTALGGFVIAAAVAVLGGLSWACTPHAMMADIQPGEGPAGMTVALRGNHFEARQIEIRLNSSQGRLLAVATGPELSHDLKIPTDLQPGWIHLVALSRSTEDPTQLNGLATRSFRVTAPWAGGTTTDTPVPTAGNTSPAVADAEPAPSPSAAPAPGPAATATQSPAATATPSPGATGAPNAPSAPAAPAVLGGPTTPAAASSGAGGAATAAAPARGASAAPAATATGRSATTSGPALVPTVVAATPLAPAAPDQRVSSRSATGEAWSSFAGQPAGPGLAADPVGAGDARDAAPAGLVLLGVGLAALLATGTAALAHQRRPRKA